MENELTKQKQEVENIIISAFVKGIILIIKNLSMKKIQDTHVK